MGLKFLIGFIAESIKPMYFGALKSKQSKATASFYVYSPDLLSGLTIKILYRTGFAMKSPSHSLESSLLQTCPCVIQTGLFYPISYSVFNGNLWRENSAIAREFFGEYVRVVGFAIILNALGNLCRRIFYCTESLSRHPDLGER